MSYHEDKPLINGRLSSYATVKMRLGNSNESVFPRAEAQWLLRSDKQPSAALPSNAFVNTTLCNSGTYYVTVFCVVRADPR
jgi:hypothetical protein